MGIVVESLYKEFSVPGGTEIAVNNIDFEVGDQEFITIVGPSGCGKTTTLRCISGLETPTRGKILVNGEDVSDVPCNQRNFAMMFQNIALYPHMTIIDNISYPLKVRGVSKSERYEQARAAAETMEISELLDKKPGELSGGQRQRAALARTVVQSPRAFLMDEPLSDLDAKLKVAIRKEIQRIHEKVQKPTIYVTHDQEEAMTMSDRILIMNDGEIEQAGSPSEVYNEPVNEFVASFIGNPSMNFINVNADVTSDDSLVLDIDSTNFTVPFSGQLASDTVTVGFRPEEASISDQGVITGEVELIENLGNQLLLTILSEFGELLVTSTDNGFAEGQQVSLKIDGERVHLFDPISGQAIS